VALRGEKVLNVDDQEPHGEELATVKKLRDAPMVTLDSAVLDDVKVSLHANLGKGFLTVSELLALKRGSVVTLGTSLDGLVDLTLNDRVIAKGELVAVGDQFGVRIVEIVAKQL
jgi:flagellar motor switch protein FliN